MKGIFLLVYYSEKFAILGTIQLLKNEKKLYESIVEIITMIYAFCGTEWKKPRKPLDTKESIKNVIKTRTISKGY